MPKPPPPASRPTFTGLLPSLYVDQHLPVPVETCKWNEDWQQTCSAPIDTEQESLKRRDKMAAMVDSFKEAATEAALAILKGGVKKVLPDTYLHSGILLRDVFASEKLLSVLSERHMIAALMNRELLAASEILSIAPFLTKPISLPLMCIVTVNSVKYWAYAPIPWGKATKNAEEDLFGVSLSLDPSFFDFDPLNDPQCFNPNSPPDMDLNPSFLRMPVLKEDLSGLLKRPKMDTRNKSFVSAEPLPLSKPVKLKESLPVDEPANCLYIKQLEDTVVQELTGFDVTLPHPAKGLCKDPQVNHVIQEVSEFFGYGKTDSLAGPVSLKVLSCVDNRLYFLDVARFLATKGATGLRTHASAAQALALVTKTLRPELVRAIQRPDLSLESTGPYTASLKLKPSYNNYNTTYSHLASILSFLKKKPSQNLSQFVHENGFCISDLGIMYDYDRTNTEYYTEIVSRCFRHVLYTEILPGYEEKRKKSRREARLETVTNAVLALLDCAEDKESERLWDTLILPEWRRRYPQCEAVRRCNPAVLMRGETPTEKETARLLHHIPTTRDGTVIPGGRDKGEYPIDVLLLRRVLELCHLKAELFGRHKALCVRVCVRAKSLEVRELRAHNENQLQALIEKRGVDTPQALVHYLELALCMRWKGKRDEVTILQRALVIRMRKDAKSESTSALHLMTLHAGSLLVHHGEDVHLRRLHSTDPFSSKTKTYENFNATYQLCMSDKIPVGERHSFFSKVALYFEKTQQREVVHALYFFAMFQLECLKNSRCKVCSGRAHLSCTDCKDDRREIQVGLYKKSKTKRTRAAGSHVPTDDPHSLPWLPHGVLLCEDCHSKAVERDKGAFPHSSQRADESPIKFLQNYLAYCCCPQFSQEENYERIVMAKLHLSQLTSDPELLGEAVRSWGTDLSAEHMPWVIRLLNMKSPTSSPTPTATAWLYLTILMEMTGEDPPQWLVGGIVKLVDFLLKDHDLYTLQNLCHIFGESTPQIDIGLTEGKPPAEFGEVNLNPPPQVPRLKVSVFFSVVQSLITIVMR